MNKSVYTLFFSILMLSGFADTHIIYVDLSADRSRVDVVFKKISDISDQFSANDKMLLFVSNTGRPLITTVTQGINDRASEEINSRREELRYMLRPLKPNAFRDIDTLNAILSQHQLLPDVNHESRRIGSKVFLHFFLNPNDSQTEALVNAFLISNRLITEQGLSNNCIVRVYFDCPDEYHSICIRNINDYRSKFKDYEIQAF